MKTIARSLPAIALGVLLGGAAVAFFLSRPELESPSAAAEPEPLYWVAPMDSSYRRDGPGKSPMGMDLVPVYADTPQGDLPGTVSIDPELVSNLGVRTASVTRGRLEARVATVGYLQFDEDRLIHIHPRVSGWIDALYVTAAGDQVRQGEPLYALYSPALVNAQEELLLALEGDKPMLLQSALERLAALEVPADAIDRLRETRRVSRTVVFRSPQDGVVDMLNVREGMYVEPGMEVMSVGSLERLWLIAEVFERQASVVREGDRVRMHLDYLPARRWEGQVAYVYPTLDLQTRTARIRMPVDNRDGYLRPGMFAQVEIDGQPGEEGLLIPREALIRTGAGFRVVRVLGDGRFRSVAVEVGRIAGERAELLSGLNENDRVVTSAQFLIDSESSKRAELTRIDPVEKAAHAAMDHSMHMNMEHSSHDGNHGTGADGGRGSEQ